MFLYKFLFVLICLTINSTYSAKPGSEPIIRFTSIKCNSTLKSISKFKCFIKAYNRKNTTINIQVNLTRPIFNAIMNYEINYKDRSNFYRTIINVTFNVCEVLNGTASNPIFNWMLGFLSPNFKTMIHTCPYKGSLNFINLYVDPKSFVSKFPSGIYMGWITFCDELDSNIFKIKYTQELISNDHAEF